MLPFPWLLVNNQTSAASRRALHQSCKPPRLNDTHDRTEVLSYPCQLEHAYGMLKAEAARHS